jgi:hypothetical protein
VRHKCHHSPPSAMWLTDGHIPQLKNVQLKPVLTHSKKWHFHFYDSICLLEGFILHSTQG